MAPALTAPVTEAPSRTLVKAMTSTSGSSVRMVLVDSRPSMTGIRRSISTTSGLSSRAIAKASWPSWASPTTWMSGSRERNMRSPWRTTPWSSVIRTLIAMASPTTLVLHYRPDKRPLQHSFLRPMPPPVPATILLAGDRNENARRDRGVTDGNHHHQTRQGKSSTKVDRCSGKRLLRNHRGPQVSTGRRDPDEKYLPQSRQDRGGRAAKHGIFFVSVRLRCEGHGPGFVGSDPSRDSSGCGGGGQRTLIPRGACHVGVRPIGRSSDGYDRAHLQRRVGSRYRLECSHHQPAPDDV